MSERWCEIAFSPISASRLSLLQQLEAEKMTNQASSLPHRNWYSPRTSLIIKSPNCTHVPLDQTRESQLAVSKKRASSNNLQEDEWSNVAVLDRPKTGGHHDGLILYESRKGIFQLLKYKNPKGRVVPNPNSVNTIHSHFQFSIAEKARRFINLPLYSFTFVPFSTPSDQINQLLQRIHPHQVFGLALLKRKQFPGYIVLYEPIENVAYAFEIGVIRNKFVVPGTLITSKMDIFEKTRREQEYVHPLLEKFLSDENRIFIGWNLQKETIRLNRFRQIKVHAVWSPHFLEWSLPHRENMYPEIALERDTLTTLFFSKTKVVPGIWKAIADLWLAFRVTEMIRKRWNIFYKTGEVDNLYDFLLLTAIRGDADDLTPLKKAQQLREKLSQVPIDQLQQPTLKSNFEPHASHLKTEVAGVSNLGYLSVEDRRRRLLSRPCSVFRPSEMELFCEEHRLLKKIRDMDELKTGQNEMHEVWLKSLYGLESNEAAVGMKRSRAASAFLLGSKTAEIRATKVRRVGNNQRVSVDGGVPRIIYSSNLAKDWTKTNGVAVKKVENNTRSDETEDARSLRAASDKRNFAVSSEPTTNSDIQKQKQKQTRGGKGSNRGSR